MKNIKNEQTSFQGALATKQSSQTTLDSHAPSELAMTMGMHFVDWLNNTRKRMYPPLFILPLVMLNLVQHLDPEPSSG